MDNDRTNNRNDGFSRQLKGAMKEGLGRAIGDAKLAADGAAERADGKARIADGGYGGDVMGVDRDRVEGVGHQFKGTVKQGFGRLMGDAAIEADGAAERAAGKAQNAIGSAKDEAREALGRNDARDDDLGS